MEFASRPALSKRGWRWPESPENVDSDLYRDVSSSASQVLPLDFDERARSLLQVEIERFLQEIKPSGPVLIKPSTAGDRSADHEVSTAILELALEAVCVHVPAAQIVVGDGPVSARFADISERLGWTSIARRFGVRLVDLNHDDVEKLENRWPVASSFLHADCVVNLCKAKTHRRFGVSLGLKGLLGSLAGGILGIPKLRGLHRAVPRLLYHLEHVAPPTLTLIDGVRGIEGDGPFSGTRSPSRFLCAGRGYYGPDVLATVEMGFDPVLIPYFLRPQSQTNAAGPAPPWLTLRRTRVDFFPPRSCRWLYRSVFGPSTRNGLFDKLLEEVKIGWADADLFPEA